MSTSAYLQAAVLGILQGLTEFIPISSSAHLLVLPWLMGWKTMGLTFDVVLHGGTLLAILFYFRREWQEILTETVCSIRNPSQIREQILPLALIVGTIPAALVGVLFRGLIEKHLRIPIVVVFTLIVFGLLLWVAERAGKGNRSVGNIRIQDGLWVGLAQALALVPGVSRSGITITVALLLGLSRAEAARFSFLLGTPLLAGALTYELITLNQDPEVGQYAVLTLLIGIIFSFSSGFLCIKYFLIFLQKRTYFPFVAYRLALAGFIFYWLVL